MFYFLFHLNTFINGTKRKRIDRIRNSAAVSNVKEYVQKEYVEELNKKKVYAKPQCTYRGRSNIKQNKIKP